MRTRVTPDLDLDTCLGNVQVGSRDLSWLGKDAVRCGSLRELECAVLNRLAAWKAGLLVGSFRIVNECEVEWKVDAQGVVWFADLSQYPDAPDITSPGVEVFYVRHADLGWQGAAQIVSESRAELDALGYKLWGRKYDHLEGERMRDFASFCAENQREAQKMWEEEFGEPDLLLQLVGSPKS